MNEKDIARNAVAALEHEVRSIRSSVEHITRSLKSTRRHDFTDVGKKLWDLAAFAGIGSHRWHWGDGSLVHRSQRALRKGWREVERRPVVTALSVAAIGVGIAFLVRRRMD